MPHAPLLFLVALLCPRLGGRPGDSVTYDLETEEAVLVRRVRVRPEDMRAALNGGYVIPVPGDDGDGSSHPPEWRRHQPQGVPAAS